MDQDNWREVSAEWMGEHTFIGKNSAGGTVQMGLMDGKPGISPMELLLIGVAGCTGVDVADILIKKRQPIKYLNIQVRGKRGDQFPKVYKEIEVLYLIGGNGIEPKAVEEAIRLSEDKYCSASAMMRGVAEIRSEYKIITSAED